MNNQWVKKEIKRETKKYLETNENRNGTQQNLWAVAQAVPRGKIIVVIAYLKEQGKSEVDNLPLHLMELEKEQTKPKVSGRKEITKIQAEISEKDYKAVAKMNEIESELVLEKIKLINLQPDSPRKKEKTR